MKSVAKIVRSKVESIPEGEVFSYDAFGTLATEHRMAVAKALSRLVKDGKVSSLCRGKFYRPRQTRFGPIAPSPREQLREALKGGYVSGAEAFNRLGITTQVPAVIEIASQRRSYSTVIGRTYVKFVRSYVSHVPENSLPLMLLDALKQCKHIQDASPDHVVRSVRQYIEEMSAQEVRGMANLAKAYPPRVRALFGAILESLGKTSLSDEIKVTLNSLSKYNTGVTSALNNAREWNLR